MRNRFILLAVVAAGSLVAAVAAWAGNPHFLRFDPPEIVNVAPAASARVATAASSTGADPRVLIENIVIAGVKEGVTSRLTAPYEAVYACTGSGHATELVRTLTTEADFPAAKNGRATGSLLTGPLPTPAEAAAATGFVCPDGGHLELDRVVFSNMVLSIDGGESIALDAVLVWEA